MDEAFIGKEIGVEYDIELKKPFGIRNPKNIQLIPLSIFKEQNINPAPNLEITLNGKKGIVKSVGSGRVLVDFNHPLADKDVNYKFKILRIIEDPKEKADGLLRSYIKIKQVESTFDNGVYSIKAKGFNFPVEIEKLIENELKERIFEIKKVVFE